ncbi:MAG TPA: hypothetical protein VMC85_18720 [Desulfomonilaceae bacterium]|nr:hypothetical protein [Desulfomonilaceae bacterium]
MKNRSDWLAVAPKIRTIWFMFAMIVPLIFAGILTLLSLVLTTPLMIYAGIVGKHLKDPRSKQSSITP